MPINSSVRSWKGPTPKNHCRPILIIEDDDDIRDTFREVLEFEGYEVYSAHDGREGLKIVEHLAGNPCLVLLDLMMPVMDGWQFLRELRETGRQMNFPVVVVSAVGAPSTEGAVRVMRKPIDVDDLLETVRAYC